MIEFEKIEEEEKTSLIFRDVAEDCFFVDKNNFFSQKLRDDSYNIIAHEDGRIYSANITEVNPDMVVEKIFTTGTKLVKIIIE